MKKLLTTTALVIAMAGGAHAATTDSGFDIVEIQQGDFYASKLIGAHIYNSKTQLNPDASIADGEEADWDDVGKISDILITQEGEVSAVILGIGGFLGIGERDVAVPMSAITIVHKTDKPDDRFLVISTTKEALEELPAFEHDKQMADADITDADDAAHGELLTRPDVQREGYTDVDIEAVHQMTSDDLTGAPVYGADDEKIGDIDSLVIGEDGQINALIVNVGGFLGIDEKPVKVTFDELLILKETDGDDMRIYMDNTKDALEAQPEYKG